MQATGISWVAIMLVGLMIILIASLAVGLVMLLVKGQGRIGTGAFIAAGAMLMLLFLLFAGFITPSSRVEMPAVRMDSATADMQWSGGASANGEMEVSFEPAWRKLFLLVVVAGALIAVIAWVSTHGRVLLHGHLHVVGLGLLAVFVGAVLLIFLLRSTRWPPAEVATPLPNSAQIRGRDENVFGVTTPGRALKSQSTGKKTSAKGDKPLVAESPDKSATGASKPEGNSGSDTASDSLPAWTKALPHREGDSYFVVVQSESTDPMVREQMLDEKMMIEAGRYIDEMMYHRIGVSSIIGISTEYLRKNCLRKEYPTGEAAGSEPVIYAQLEFNANFRRDIEAQYRRLVSLDRVQGLGTVVAVGLVALGGLYAFLRFTPKRAAA